MEGGAQKSCKEDRKRKEIIKGIQERHKKDIKKRSRGPLFLCRFHLELFCVVIKVTLNVDDWCSFVAGSGCKVCKRT